MITTQRLRTAVRTASLTACLASCATARPSWTSRPPQGFTNDYFTGSGTGAGGADARSAAISAAVARLAENGALRVQVVRTDTSITSERFRNTASTSLDRIDRTVQEIITTGTSPTIAGLRLAEEYHEEVNGRHEAWVLMALPKTSGLRPIPKRHTFVLRSLVLPGWGQYAMGRERQGLLMAVGTIAGIPAISAFSSLRSENLTRARSTQIQAARTSYTNQANRFGTFSTVTAAGVLGLWAYGVIDAASSPIRLYVQSDRPSPGVGLAVAIGR